jgi:TonB-dependent receptor
VNENTSGSARSLDYTLNEGSSIYAHGLFSNFKNYGDRWVYSLTDNNPNVELLGGNGCTRDEGGATNCTGTPSFNSQIRRPDISIASVLIGGKHVLTSTWFSWNISPGRSELNDLGSGTASFHSTLSNSSCQFDPALTTNLYEPQFNAACFTEVHDPSSYALNRIRINHGLSAQLNLQFDAAMAKQYHLGSHLATFEFGGKLRNSHKFDNSYQVTLSPIDSVSIPIFQFPSVLSNSDYYGGAYKLGANPAYQAVQALAEANPGQFSIDSSRAIDPANYDLVERVSAGYLMNTIDLSSKLRVVAGVRFEGTQLRTLSFDTSVVPPTFTFGANGSYVKVLPSAAIRYAVTPSTNLRVSYARGLSRPDPQDIAQAVTFTTAGSPGNIKNLVTLGNPNLKAETGDNFDILFEHYLNPFGMISAGYFYKNLTDSIVTQTFILTNFKPNPTEPAGTFTATQPINAGSAWINGVEFAYLEHLAFLPGPLKGLGISANYSYTTSRAAGLPGRSDHPRLLRDAPNTWNISPTFDRGRLSVRVGLSYNQANISSYAYQDGTPFLDGTPSDVTPGGLKGPFSDQYFYSHPLVDAEGTYNLGHGFTYVMYGLNLTNEVFGFYQGSPQFVIQREFYKPSVAAGLRWSPVREK